MKHMNDPLTDDSKPYVDTLVNLEDYNCGVLIPYNPTVDLNLIIFHLKWNNKHLTFVYSEDLEEVLDTAKFDKESKLQDAKIPRFVEFIGSLKEYIISLPNVEEDWYRSAMMTFPYPKVL